MIQPPGCGTAPSPNLPSRLPNKIIDERIFRPCSSSTCVLVTNSVLISKVCFCQAVFAPKSRKISSMAKTSAILGQPYKIVVPLFKSAAAISGNAAFLEPCILTSPFKGIPPTTLIPFKPYTPLFFFSKFSDTICYAAFLFLFSTLPSYPC